MSKKQLSTEVFRFRLSPTLLSLMRKVARRKGMKVSRFVKESVEKEIRRHASQEAKR